MRSIVVTAEYVRVEALGDMVMEEESSYEEEDIEEEIELEELESN